jgi:multicomponent K+:H+ antiporter subunit G
MIVLSISAPVTTVVLARAHLFRRRQAGDPLPAPLRTRGRTSRGTGADKPSPP